MLMQELMDPLESDFDSLKELISEAKEMIKLSKKPILLAGVEIHQKDCPLNTIILRMFT